MDKYKLIFSGQIKPDKQKDVLGRFLCKFLNISESNIDKLFSGRSFALRSNLSQQNVYELQAKLEQAGILTKVIREQQLEEEVTFQDTTQRNNTGQESVVSTDYKMRVGERTICRHCGSHLDEVPAQALVTSNPTFPTQQPVTTQPAAVSTEVVTQVSIPSVHTETNSYEVSAEIQNLNVSEAWKQRFEILEKGGAGSLTFSKFFFGEGIKRLSQSEVRSILFPVGIFVIGMLAGIFNYLFRGLVRKGLFIGSILFAIFAVIEFSASLFGYGVSPKLVPIVSGCFFTYFCCYDVYKLRVKHESFWPELPKLLGNPFLLTVMFVASLGLYGAMIYESI